MSDFKPGLAAFAALGLLALVPQGPAKAMAAQLFALRDATSPVLLEAADGGGWFHHGKRVQSAYCLRRNYWWFYRPYTTAPEDFPRCEPYFHYLESGYEGRAPRQAPYIK
jgi:hypothetical protein